MGLDNKLDINIGKLKKGKNNLITDVSGVKVGHVTIKDGDINTGVTAILPHTGNMFKDKVMASSFVINGFGKSIGLVQVDELGTIETPIILTNTLSVGTASTALVKYMMKQNSDIGDTTGTVNCTVCECNDGYLNDIRGLHVEEKHVFEAIKNADVLFDEGDVGGGTGMVCYKLKGGIGSSSRVVELDGKEYTLGAMVMTNCGLKEDLIINGRKFGKEIIEIDNNIEKRKDINNSEDKNSTDETEKGSIIMIIATDIPLSERQLKRVCKRSAAGLARTGSNFGNGSGDICVAFTTANKIKHYNDNNIEEFKMVSDNNIDVVFRAAIESVEEAILSSLFHAHTVVGRKDHTIKCIKEYYEK